MEHTKLLNLKNAELDENQNIVKKKHSIKHSKDNALENEEKADLIRTLKNLDIQSKTKYRYEVLIHLMMSAGLRVSEALQVREEWFKETEEGIILNIPSKARDLSNLKRDWKPKTKAGKREVFFLDKGIGSKVMSFFISQPKGIGFSRQRAYQIIKMLGSKINKPDLHPHALRSTYANMLIYQGVNITTLCYYMGWLNMNTAIAYIKTSNVAARKDLIEKFTNN